ncbi:MAG: ATP/GTP-binding protein [Actinobacteria bacterium]|nr:ATP/GTP-binding protein [Actinomycetota bacterium]
MDGAMRNVDVVTIKVVVTGPFAAGKTTLISTISEIPVLATETSVSDESAATKDHTTVTMDFGKLTVKDEEMLAELYMFGTPGQDRFDFMWDVLAEGMDGYILMVDLSRGEDSLREAANILEHFRNMSDAPFIVGANRGTNQPEMVERLHEVLGADPQVEIVPCEATERESAKQLLLVLLIKVLSTLADDAEVAVS